MEKDNIIIMVILLIMIIIGVVLIFTGIKKDKQNISSTGFWLALISTSTLMGLIFYEIIRLIP